MERVALGRVEPVGPDREAAPLWTKHLAAAENPHQLVGRIRRPDRARLPILDGPNAHAEQIRAAFDSQEAGEPRLTEAGGGDRKMFPGETVPVPDRHTFNFA